MKKKKNNKPMPPPAIRTAIELGIHREIPRHELRSGSWQLEMYDKQGRRFYESTAAPEPIGRQLTVDEAAAEAAERGSTIRVQSPWGGEMMGYDEFVVAREQRRGQESNVEPIAGKVATQGADLRVVNTEAA